MIEDARVLDDSKGEKHEARRKYKDSDLGEVGMVNYKNSDGTRVGVFIKSSAGPKSWTIILNGQHYGDLTEVRREKAAIICNQNNNSQSYKIDFNAGKIFSMDRNNKGDWAEILQITLVTLTTTK